ncbi:Carboxylesterase family [Musa troglodytarum]|uniref:Carboxylesterase family n=1 Tax=Musa troglodytarum TaxID=320322 RepID=A0A9E7GPE9_9LILI|nr:Carboxylesterase family [Musa troglodytarum]
MLGSEDPVFDDRIDSLWRLLCPGTTGLDDPRVNPLAELAPSLGALPCRRVLVAVAEKDRLRESDRAYYEALRRSGWEGEALLLESEGEQHVFHLHNPHSDKARAKLRTVVDFLTAE